MFVADASGKVFELPAGQTSLSMIGSGFTSPSALAFDSNGDLFVADNGTGADDVVEIYNTGTNGAFAAGTQKTLISATTPIGGMTLKNPTGLAFGADGTLYIADGTESRVVAYNPATGVGGLTVAVGASGLVTPQGLAADAAGNLYVADPGAQEVVIFSAAGVESTLSNVSGVTNPEGVAVDASGSVLIADGPTGNIVRVPSWNDQSQTAGLTPSEAITLETISPQVSSLAMDSSGNIAVASASGKAAYEVQRNAGSINLGQVPDGFSNSGTVYLMNAGNEPATVGSVTEPSNYSWITLDPATTNGCQPGTGPAGAWCMLTATFASPTGFATGSLVSGTAEIVVTTPSEQIPVTISGTPTSSPAQQQVVSFSQPACAVNSTPCSGYVGQQITVSATAVEGATAPNPGTPTGLAVSLGSTSPSSTCTLSTTTASGNTYSVTITLNGAGTCTVNATAASGTGPGNLPFGQATAQVPIAVSTITTPGVPALVVNQATWIGDFGVGYSGGFTSGANPVGGSFAVNSLGDVIDGNSYGAAIQIWTPSSSNGYPVTYTKTSIPMPSGSNVAGASVDAANNIYGANLYYGQLWKVPFVNGAYATTVPSSVPNCVGTAGSTPDTTFCAFTISGFANGEAEVNATAFDINGNLFLVSKLVSSGLNGIYEIPAASLATISGGNVAMTPIYTSDPNTIASIAFDAKGNLFFTDIQYGATSGGTPVNPGSSETYASNLFELANTGTASAPTYSNVAPGQTGGPVALQTFTNASGQIGNYDNAMSGVAADRTNGVAYFSTISDGIWEFADNGTPFTATSLPTFYAVAGKNGTTATPGDMTGGKGLAVGAPGTVYAVGADSTSDDLYMLTFGGTTAPITTHVAAYLGSSTTGPAVVVDNALAWCPTPGASLNFAFAGADASEFSGSQVTGCSAIVGGGGYDGSFSNPVAVASSYPVTVTPSSHHLVKTRVDAVAVEVLVLRISNAFAKLRSASTRGLSPIH